MFTNDTISSFVSPMYFYIKGLTCRSQACSQVVNAMATVLCALSLLLVVSVSASDSVSSDVRSVPAANATRDLRTINEYWVFTTLENLQRRLDRLEFGGHRVYKGHRGFFHGYRGKHVRFFLHL